MNKCVECQNTTVSDIVCPTCKVGIMKGKWTSPCIEYTCQKCKEKIIGGSFYYPCMTDETKYQVRIITKELSQKQMVFISKYLYIPVLQLKEELHKECMIRKDFYLIDVMEFVSWLEKNDIEYEIIPEILYKDYRRCEKNHSVCRL